MREHLVDWGHHQLPGAHRISDFLSENSFDQSHGHEAKSPSIVLRADRHARSHRFGEDNAFEVWGES
jgi:hypothetical protein